MDKKFLAINTAGPTVEAALYNGRFFRDSDFRNASAVLMPAIDGLLKPDLTLGSLDYIACVVGPGSFTGIRIGVSAVRSFCYALSKPALGIHYLKMLAYNKSADGRPVMSIADGGNGTAYVAVYDKDRRETEPCVCMPQSEAVLRASAFGGAVCTDERLCALVKGAIAPDKTCEPLIRAARENAGEAASWRELLPVYVRESQAERDAAKKNA